MARKTDDPYKQLAELMTSNAKRNGLQQGCIIGEVVQAPPDLIVMADGMPIDKSHLWIDEYCLLDHLRTVKGHIVSETQNRGGGSGDAAYESHNHPIDNDYTASLIYTDTWEVGDKVALLPIYSSDDMQTAQDYIVFIRRLVRLDGGMI